MPGCYYRDSDYCFLDDLTEGDYIDLTLNPERFTGYAGISAQRVWSSIYRENCFGLSESKISRKPDSMVDPDEEKICLEQRVYYKIISGVFSILCCEPSGSAKDKTNLTSWVLTRFTCEYLDTHMSPGYEQNNR